LSGKDKRARMRAAAHARELQAQAASAQHHPSPQPQPQQAISQAQQQSPVHLPQLDSQSRPQVHGGTRPQSNGLGAQPFLPPRPQKQPQLPPQPQLASHADHSPRPYHLDVKAKLKPLPHQLKLEPRLESPLGSYQSSAHSAIGLQAAYRQETVPEPLMRCGFLQLNGLAAGCSTHTNRSAHHNGSAHHSGSSYAGGRSSNGFPAVTMQSLPALAAHSAAPQVSTHQSLPHHKAQASTFDAVRTMLGARPAPPATAVLRPSVQFRPLPMSTAEALRRSQKAAAAARLQY